MSVQWVFALLDVPPDLLDVSLGFWTVATGATLGDPIGDHGEFLPLRPPSGDVALCLQRTQDGPVRVHPDLSVQDPDAEASRAEGLGAAVTDRRDGLVVATSPGGLPFCLVRHEAEATRPEPVGPAGARSVVDQVCLDIPADRYEEECAFWSSLTGWARTGVEGHTEFHRLARPSGIPFAFLLQRLDDPSGDQPGVRCHLDLACEDRDAVAERLVAVGAHVVRRMPGWTVLRDPAGLVFCATDRRPGAV